MFAGTGSGDRIVRNSVDTSYSLSRLLDFIVVFYGQTMSNTQGGYSTSK